MLKKTLITFLILLSTSVVTSSLADCIKCVHTTSGQVVWGDTTAPGVVGGAGGTTPAQAACSIALFGSSPAAGAGNSYPKRAGATCGTACSNKNSGCTVVGSSQCDTDFFADNLESCSNTPGTLFECSWVLVHDCCSAAPPGDTCTQTGTAPNTSASCGTGGCGLWDNAFGYILPPQADDDFTVAIMVAIFVLGLLISAVFMRRRRQSSTSDQD